MILIEINVNSKIEPNNSTDRKKSQQRHQNKEKGMEFHQHITLILLQFEVVK